MAGHMIIPQLLSWCIRLSICRYDIAAVEDMMTANKFMNDALENTANTFLAFIDYGELPKCEPPADCSTAIEAQKHTKIFRNLDEYAFTSDKCGIMYFRNRRSDKDGDKMSPAVFKCIMKEVFERWDLENRKYGILIEQNGLTYLWFAKELVIFSSNPQTLRNMITEMQHEDKYVGLNLHEDLMAAYKQQVEVPPKEIHLGYEQDLDYLEQFFVVRDAKTGEVKRKIHLTLEIFWALHTVPKTKKLKRTYPVEDTGEASCSENECPQAYLAEDIVEHFEMSLLDIRIIEKINSTFMKKMTGCRDILKRKLVGQVIRTLYTDEMVTVWTPSTKQTQGFHRGPERSEDIVDAEMNWYTFTKNKPKCKKD